ncbi:MAG: HEAT repeat domain-containing protein [Planctomycetia bacterium]|nr:HEAT repeat domain-containing protein [Planctomycetia bacterium]
MTRRHKLAICVLALLGTPAARSIADDDAPTGSDWRTTIRVPPGFEVQLVAGLPLVEHPVMAGFDERGRLFVADNAGVNFPAEELLEKLPNCVRMLEDTDGDGQFDRSTVFADKMTFPMGALAHRGALYVASPPFIWRLEDTDGDGVADRRDQIVGRFGFIGNAADIHGCFLGPEGRIYWCDGRHGHNFVDAEGNQISKGLAARVFSCRADGSDVQVFCGGGMDNPVEVAFTDEGDMIGTMTFYNPDDVRHDALMHFVYGGVYPRKHPSVAEFKRTGDFLPALALYGTVAPSGLGRYRGSEFGDGYRDNFFSVHFNTHKVLRHALERTGATFRSRDEDFLVSSDADFHPTDVLEDADGSLLVVDTGGWFRIGCPTSQVAKPEIGGAIYRVRRTGGPRPADARGLALAWGDATADELAARLDDPRPAVRDRAIEELGARGHDGAVAVHAVVNDAARGVTARQNAVWAAVRIAGPKARTAIRQALKDADPGVRQAAAYCAGSLRDPMAQETLRAMVVTDEPQVRREAATALGRLRHARAVPALLDSLRRGGDRFVEHAAIYALIEINDREGTLAGLAGASADVRRAALVALDQMDSGALARDEVTGLLDTGDTALQRSAMDVIARHPAWAGEIVGLLAEWLGAADLSEERSALLRGALLAFAGDAEVQDLIGKALADPLATRPSRLLLLEVIARSDVRDVPARWTAAIRRGLDSDDAEESRQAVIAAAEKGDTACDERLLAIAEEKGRDDDLRVAAAAAAARHGRTISPAAFALLTEQVATADAPALRRMIAAAALGAAALSGEQLAELAHLVALAGPLELPPLLRAFRDCTDGAIGLRLVESLRLSPGADGQSADELAKLLDRFGPEARQAATPLIARLTAAQSQQAAQVAALAARVDEGAPDRGRVIFFGAKAACGACHRVGAEGGKIGPDLSKIGEIRTARDLAESILAPSASLARGYESVAVATRSGQAHTGVVSRETSAAIYLVTPERTEVRIDRADIDELAPSRQSIMPQGLDRVLTEQELSDLMAWLKTLK